jgi:hypothetical protein
MNMMRAIVVLVAVVAASCATVQTSEHQEGIARSCDLQWGPEPEGLRDGPFSHSRVCQCAARSVVAAWSEQRVAAFDRRFASYARDYRTYADSITLEMFRERGPEVFESGFPEPSAALGRDLGEYGARVDFCVSHGRPATDAEFLDYRAERARINEREAPN